MFHRSRTLAALATAVLALTTLAACGSNTSSSNGADTKTLVVATHDSWAMPKSVMAKFEKESGYKVRILKSGDVGALTNKLVLTKGAPIADAVYGIDNTFATRAVDEGVLSDYTSPDVASSASAFAQSGKAGQQLTPVDYGDVCVNVDDTWFAKKKLTEPTTFDDLLKPTYKDLMVTPAPTTSSTGLAFLAGTVGAKGQQWDTYWKGLVRNGLKIDAGWSDAYETDFTAGGGKGTRPIVVSYSSSPPFTIPEGAAKPTTSALLDTCFRQVEYAGVLAGAKNAKGARAFVDFLTGKDVQAALPDSMYVYPTDTSVALPTVWAKFAPVAKKPWTVPADEISKNRTAWLTTFRDLSSQ